MINGIPEWEDIPQCPKCGTYLHETAMPRICPLCEMIAAEREACAKIAEFHYSQVIAYEIRARGAK